MYLIPGINHALWNSHDGSQVYFIQHVSVVGDPLDMFVSKPYNLYMENENFLLDNGKKLKIYEDKWTSVITCTKNSYEYFVSSLMNLVFS